MRATHGAACLSVAGRCVGPFVFGLRAQGHIHGMDSRPGSPKYGLIGLCRSENTMKRMSTEQVEIQNLNDSRASLISEHRDPAGCPWVNLQGESEGLYGNS